MKIFYNKNLMRVKATIDKSDVDDFESLYHQMIQKAETKMNSLKENKEIDYFRIYKRRVKRVFEAFKNNNRGNRDTVSLTLAAGAKDIPGFSIEPIVDNNEYLLKISIKDGKESLDNLCFDVFKYVFYHKLNLLGVVERGDDSQIQACFLRAQSGQEVVNVLISKVKVATSSSGYSLSYNKKRSELKLIINDILVFDDIEKIKLLLSRIKSVINEKSENSEDFELLQESLLFNIKKALYGPKSLDVDVPMVTLAGLKLKLQNTKRVVEVTEPTQDIAASKDSGTNAVTVQSSKSTKNKKIKRLFDFKIVDDNSVLIVSHKENIYKVLSVGSCLNRIKKELKSINVRFYLGENELEDLKAAIKQERPLDLFVASQSKPPVNAAEPYLHSTYLDNVEKCESKNLRESQKVNIVYIDDIVAEIRYKQKGIAGVSVTGAKIDYKIDEVLEVTFDSSCIEERGAGKFYALVEGVPSVKDDTIEVSDEYVHADDVNLRTGNINYDGNVKITGSIENGSSVRVTGNLKVEGLIQCAEVIVFGDLNASAGLRTSDKCTVVVHGNISASFIEGSNIKCYGNVKVEKIIRNSKILAEGSIYVTGAGGIASGGELKFKNFLKTGSLGLGAAKTIVSGGISPLIQERLIDNKARLKKLVLVLNRAQGDYNELKNKEIQTMSESKILQRDELNIKVTKLTRVVEKCKARAIELKDQLKDNLDVKIYIRDNLSRNIEIKFNQKQINVPTDVAAVIIQAKKVRGSHIIAMSSAGSDKAS